MLASKETIYNVHKVLVRHIPDPEGRKALLDDLLRVKGNSSFLSTIRELWLHEAMKVLCNTYPKHLNAPHAEPGDEVHWEHRQSFQLVRNSDGKTVFSTSPVDKNGNRRSNGQSPILTGIIAEVKSKEWVLEIE